MTFQGISDDQLSAAARALLEVAEASGDHELRAALMPALRLLHSEVQRRGGLNLPQIRVLA